MNILVVDDEANLRAMLRVLLEEEGYTVTETGSAEMALDLLQDHRPDAVLLDLILPGASGLESLPEISKRSPGVPVIMMSGEATLADAARATREGAFHFLEKPLSPESVLATLRGAFEVTRARELSRTLREEFGPGALLVGRSPAIERVREVIRKVAPTESRVLIMGESGTGKELAATAIHNLSNRRGEAFVRVNSAALPRELVESEMFGHERGAFTGADRQRRGRFELAHKGTLFLDEVGDLGMEAQGKFLRALESGTIERVGGRASIRVDVRVIAATNRDLHDDVRSGRFREDLLFRLEVVPLTMPALRERPEDLPLLVEHVETRLRQRQGLRVPRLTDEAVDVLHTHSWPGNVRELINLLERLAILHPTDPVDRMAMREALGLTRGHRQLAIDFDLDTRSLRERLDEFESALIQSALDTAGDNVAEAARRLKTDRANLHRRMRRLGLRDSD